ncbi:hypothetical protein BSL78_08632 [Apostichopus japonicus]|uniref:Uncharacterized protein n=1 Tax=Stichopus japonicus TaxID=307972 RepID=A0A2G8L2D0_STIJA|nr:hypothetical protein BSL78_08632 [Apostichopus japonicus]
MKQAKRGEVNWSPIIPDGEDNKTLKEHTEFKRNTLYCFRHAKLGNEFKRLTDTELHKNFESFLSKAASKILSEVKLKPQLLPIVMKHLQIEEKTVAALLVLPVVFRSKSFFKLYEEERLCCGHSRKCGSICCSYWGHNEAKVLLYRC